MIIFSVKNVLDGYEKGWTNVNLLDGKEAYLPYSTNLGLIEDDLLVILEGHHKGSLLKYSSNNLEDVLVGEDLRTFNKIEILYNLKLNKLIFPNEKEYFLAKTCSKIPPGRYIIKIPHYQHKKTCKKDYLKEALGGSRFAETWFQVISNRNTRSDIFLHSGEFSDGCLTVSISKNNPRAWTDIYLQLIKNRNTSTTVASLLVE